jgi:hypothetical protein
LVPGRQAALTRWHLDGAEHDNNRLEAATVWGDSSLRADGSDQFTAISASTFPRAGQLGPAANVMWR